MKVYKHVTANDIVLNEMPFLRELSMEAYLVENENILKLDDDNFSDVSIIDVELSLKQGRKCSDGRIDILVQYGQETFGIVELKLGVLNLMHLEQLSDYMKEKRQLYDKYIKTITDLRYDNINWVGVLVGTNISSDLENKLNSGYLIENNIPVAALSLSRYRGEDNQIYVITDTIFNNLSRKFDRTKFKYKNQIYNKGRLVLAVIKDFVADQGDITYSQLEKKFPQKLQGSIGVFVKEEKAQERYNKTGYKRYYIKDDEVITLSDSTIAVSNQWGKDNIYNFVKRAKELGYIIEIIK